MCGTNRRTRLISNQDYRTDEYQNRTQLRYQTEKNVKFVVDANYTFCHNCNFSQNIKDAKFCQQCGNEIQTCPISKMKFSLNQEFVQCTNCKWMFHRQHLDNWMIKKRSCPICNGAPEDMTVGRIGNMTS